MNITNPEFYKAFELKEKMTIEEAKDYIKNKMLSIGYTVEVVDSVRYKSFIHRWLDIGISCKVPVDFTRHLCMMSPDGNKKFIYKNDISISLGFEEPNNPYPMTSVINTLNIERYQYYLDNTDNFRTFVDKYMMKNFKPLINRYKREQNIKKILNEN